MTWLLPLAVAAQLTGATLDTKTTLDCLHRGGRELNPWVGPHPTAGRVLLTKGVGVAAVSAGQWFFHRTHHDKIAATLGFAAGGTWSGAAAWNVKHCGW